MGETNSSIISQAAASATTRKYKVVLECFSLGIPCRLEVREDSDLRGNKREIDKCLVKVGKDVLIKRNSTESERRGMGRGKIRGKGQNKQDYLLNTA